ncbi:hypothetical protein SteCoe_32062 [Stentor coeruleus]|uniref:Translin-associated factor X-interacting protein 1 N-terminal domain-containing protein n=1 Tax=Stentor coeruleus TaxID=5963 RepID=A0A1R2B0A2_9CILI|nr:hypothetical protein SteCoe_32062 [Stentor coeruleus]
MSMKIIKHSKNTNSCSIGLSLGNSVNSPYQGGVFKKILIKHRSLARIKKGHDSQVYLACNKSKIINNNLKEETITGPCSSKFLEDIKEKITKIEKIHRDKPLNFEVFEVYRNCFEKIIQYDLVYGNILKNIKKAYEDWIKIKIGYVAENTQLKYELLSTNKILKEAKDKNHRLKDKLQSISNENKKLLQSILLKTHNISNMQEFLNNSTVFKSEDSRNDIQSKTIIFSENNQTKCAYAKLKNKLQKVQRELNKYKKIINFLKDEGYPVDQTLHYICASDNTLRKSYKNSISEESSKVFYTQPDYKTSKKPFVLNINMDTLKNVLVTPTEDSLGSSF